MQCFCKKSRPVRVARKRIVAVGRPRWRRVASLVFVLALSASAFGQVERTTERSTRNRGVSANESATVDLTNPLDVIRSASRALPVDGIDVQIGPATGEPGDAVIVGNGADAGKDEGLSSTLSILALLTILTIAPSMIIMMTSFTRIVVVFALLRQAIGTQSLPPSQVIVGLSMFMTLLVMGPTFQQINEKAIVPLQEDKIDEIEAWDNAKAPLRNFMLAQIDYADNWDDVSMILTYRDKEVPDPENFRAEDIDMLTLVPAFILSELKVAFLMGFRLYLPFLIVDMVVSSVLISMGMIMLPPVMISLPFKLLLFVLVDGWHLVAGNLLESFVVGEQADALLNASALANQLTVAFSGWT